MGNSQSIKRVNFEDIQFILNAKSDIYVLINTLNENMQGCLIPTTVSIQEEVELLNKILKQRDKHIKIIIYGRNCNDEKIYTKYSQIESLGITNVFIYTGGLFEWLMLQDIYGFEEFPTTKKELDILKYKSNQVLNMRFLE
jgi:hypothetical protein